LCQRNAHSDHEEDQEERGGELRALVDDVPDEHGEQAYDGDPVDGLPPRGQGPEHCDPLHDGASFSHDDH
jgi:hypothetical protein